MVSMASSRVIIFYPFANEESEFRRCSPTMLGDPGLQLGFANEESELRRYSLPRARLNIRRYQNRMACGEFASRKRFRCQAGRKLPLAVFAGRRFGLDSGNPVVVRVCVILRSERR